MKTKVSPANTPSTSARTQRKPVKSPYFQKEVQLKLKSGKKGDKYEMEADAMADKVVNGQPVQEEMEPTANGVQKSGLFSQISKGVQLAEEEKLQTKKEEEELQMKQEEEELQMEEQEEVQASGEEEELQKEEEKELQAKGEEEELQAEEEELQAKKEEEDLQKEEEEVQMKPEEDEELQMEEEEEVQAKKEEEELQSKKEEEEVQAQGNEEESGNVDESIESTLSQQSEMGDPLPEPVKAKMENQFRADFSGIRIHADDTAVLLSKALKAKAFTHGRDLYFNEGKFDPNTRDGEHLLAHELTHTVQQEAVEEKEEQVIQLQEDEGYMVRPEILKAISIARAEIGKINTKLVNADKTRIGWEKLHEIFYTAFGNKEVIPEQVIKYITMTEVGGKKKDALPSWCGIFVWYSLKKSGVPVPDWKLGENILKHTVPRKPGELPRKGDIAFDNMPNQHFAMVTGVEDPQSAEGKDYNSIMVATINGNTAGSDNLGGQVEEKWETIGKWRQDAQSGFMDPIGKLNMPDVPLVKTGVTPDEITDQEGAEEKEPVQSEEEKAAAEAKQEKLNKLESEEIVTPPDVPAEGETAIDVELPAPPEFTETEEVAKIEVLDLSGSSDESMVKYTEANPSQIAANYGELGPALEGKANSEKKEIAENPPKLEVITSGTLEEGITPPDQLGMPAGGEITDGTTGEDPGNLEVTPHEDKGPVPTNEENEKLLDKHDDEGFLGWLKSNIFSFMSKIKTTDNGVNTSAGERPNVDMEGDADPERMKNQRSDADDQVTGQRDEVTEQFKNHPGQSNVKPREVNEEKTAAVNGEPTAQVKTEEKSSLTDFSEAPLPKNVRDKTDEMMQPGLHANLGEAKAKTQEEATKRDTDKKTEIDSAESKAGKMSEDADKEQRTIVLDNRKTIADKQREGIEDAYGQVNDFKKDADTEQVKNNKEISDKVKTSEEGAKKELEAGEKKAEDKKIEKEKEAAAKKKELEKEQENDSWWDRVKSAVKKAVKAITDAIDAVFNALRKAVADIIEAAKNLAIDLINKARTWVIDKLNKFRDWAKEQVNKYLKEHFPGLAKRINDGIDSVVDTAIDGVNYVADKAIEGVEALANALAAALDKILAAFQEGLKAAVKIAGAVLTGDFAEALKIAIEAACNIAGIDPQPIFDFIDKAKNLILDILKNPMKFFNNVMAAIGGGVRGFFTNIKQHLISGLIGWLTGALSETPLKMPESFDVMGIFNLVMQILGLTYENIKARIIKKYPPAEKVFYVIEEGLAIIKRVFTEGPQVLWEIVKEKLSNLKEMVMGAIRDYVIKTVVFEGITWLLGLLNPAGALVKILKLAFDLIMWLVDRFDQIVDFVKSVYNSVAAIASGQIGAASKAVEDAMSRSLPVLISLLASLAGLGGIGKTIQNLIQKVTDPINKIIDGLIDKGIDLVKKFLKKGKDVAKSVKDKLVSWWKAKKTFKDTDGRDHKLYFKGTQSSATLMVASSDPGPYATFLQSVDVGDDKEKKKAKDKAIDLADKIHTEQNRHIGVKDEKEKEKQEEERKTNIEKLLAQISGPTSLLFGKDLPESDVTHSSQSVGGGVMGTMMDANILTTKLPKQGTTGSEPTHEKHEVYDKLNQRKSGGGSYYIRGHLLNHNIHGPGKWFNMVPLSRTGNSNHEKNVESKVKSAVTAGEIVRYTVEPVGNWSAVNQSNDDLSKAGIEPANWTVLKTIGEAEQHVPKGLQCEASILESKGGKEKKSLYNGTVLNPVEQSVSSYQMESKPALAVNLTSDGAQHIADNTGINLDEAKAVKNAIAKLQKDNVILSEYAQLADSTVSAGTIDKLRKSKNVVLK